MHDSLILIHIANESCDSKSILLKNGVRPTTTVSVNSSKELVTVLADSVKKYRNIVVVGGLKGKLQNTVDVIAKATALQLVTVDDEEDALESNMLFRIPQDSDAVSVGGLNCGCRIEKSNQVIIMLTDDEKMLGKIIPAAVKNGFFVTAAVTAATAQKRSYVATAPVSDKKDGTENYDSYDSESEQEYYDDVEDDEEYEEEVRPPRMIKPLGKGNNDAINLDEVFGSKESNKYVYQKRGSWVTKLLVTLAILLALAAGLYIFYDKTGAGLISDFVFNRVSTIYKQSLGEDDKFAALREKNEDISGWLKISQTDINFPVMLSSDYSNTTFFRFQNRYGTPYIDSTDEIGYENRNITIHGTNLDGERVFAPLESYRELSYYKAHPTISFDTDYGDATYKIFAIVLLDDEESFDVSKNEFVDNEFYDFINELNTRSLIFTTVEVDTNSELLTLTTELDDFDGARIAIVAKKVAYNEASDVDVDGAMKNPSAIIPPRFSGESQYETATVAETLTTATTEVTTESEEETTKEVSTEEETTEETTKKTTEIKKTTEKATQKTTVQNAGEVADTTQRKTTEATTTKPSTTQTTTQKTTAATTTKAKETTKATSTTKPTSSNGSGSNSNNNADEDTPSSSAKIRFSANGTTYYKDRTEVIARIVQAEVGSGAPLEAMKAQAVTAYSYIKARQNGNPNAAVSGMAYSTGTLSAKCLEAAKAVDGIAVKYNGKYASLYCFGISAGKTAWASDVWGGANYPYTSSVDSSVDASVSGFSSTATFTSAELAKLLNEYLDFDIKTVKDKNKWVVVTEYDANNLYAKRVSIGGKKTVYGESFRCYAMQYKIRSHCFTVKYDEKSDKFTFNVKGWGHGVGLSQEGAIQYANQGKDYKWILDHYFNINSSGAVYVKD